MKKICIAGAGVAGTVLALELNNKSNFEITLIDNDNLNKKFDTDLDLKKRFFTPFEKLKTTGYGFGGTSNLWQGVLTDLDDEDYNYLHKNLKFNLKNELLSQRKNLSKYFGRLHFENFVKSKKSQIDTFISTTSFTQKIHSVQYKPTRFRKILNKQISKSPNLKIIEKATILRLETSSNNKIKNLIYKKNDKENILEADIFVISMGALESPRILLQSFEKNPLINKLIGRNLMDHPYCMIGNLFIPKNILYKDNGKKNLFNNNSMRIGYRINKSFRISNLNHSIFIRPRLNDDLEKTKEYLKYLMFVKFSLFSLLRLMLSKSFIRLILNLFIEKIGLGQLVNSFTISFQAEQYNSLNSKVNLSFLNDNNMRRIPNVYQDISQEIIKDVKNIQNIINNNLKNGAHFEKFKISKNSFFSGAHYSGTCQLGINKKLSVVDKNLNYHNIDNLYICDASILPKIGNANLVYTIAKFSSRLARHLANKYK